MAWRSTRRTRRKILISTQASTRRRSCRSTRRGAVKVRRWDAGEDDRAQGALAARVRGALWRRLLISTDSRGRCIVQGRRLIPACGTRSRAALPSLPWPRPSAKLSARTRGSGRRTSWDRASPTAPRARRRSGARDPRTLSSSTGRHSSGLNKAMARHAGTRSAVGLPARAPAPRAAHAAARAGFDLLDTDRDGVVRRAEFFDAVGAVNRVVPPERQIDGDSVWGLLDCNGDGELERNRIRRNEIRPKDMNYFVVRFVFPNVHILPVPPHGTRRERPRAVW